MNVLFVSLGCDKNLVDSEHMLGDLIDHDFTICDNEEDADIIVVNTCGFIESAKEYIGKDHSGMDDETQAGELYLDSLAVLPEYRRQGIASRLIWATKERADRMGLPCVGLLVDKGNPDGEALYASAGFKYVNDSVWGGHPMKHLVL